MRRRYVLPITAAIIAITACGQPSLFLVSPPAPGHWEDEIISVGVRIQHDLLAVVTIENKSEAPQVVPAPLLVSGSTLNSYEIVNAAGQLVATSAVHADWTWEARPMISLEPGGLYSESIDLRLAFPKLRAGEYRLRFSLRSDERDRSTWDGKAELTDIPIVVRATESWLGRLVG